MNTEFICTYNGNISKARWKIGVAGLSFQYKYTPDNLPDSIAAGTDRSIAFCYTSSGRKVRETTQSRHYVPHPLLPGNTNASNSLNPDATLNSPFLIFVDTRSYCDNLVYSNTLLQRMLVDGGYITSGVGGIPKYHFYQNDHLGNVRVVTDADGTVEEVNHYYPYGALMGESQNTTTQPYKYNGKELDRSFGLDWYDYGARWMDGVGGRWSSMDPLCEKYYHISPYAYCVGNPVNRIDPDGKNPIYDKNGVFLGTDNLGLQGYYYVMNHKDFKQGMSHMKVGNLAIMGDLPEDVTKKIDAHYNNLPKRPDYDGFVTIAEGVEWAKSHPYALMNPTPDNTLYIDASKLDFGSLSTSNFSVVGAKEPQDLFNKLNIIESAINPTLFATVYALGRVNMILQNKDTRTVKIVNDSATDYDWNLGGSFMRNTFIINNNRLTGIDPHKHGFKVYYYGVGTLRK